MTTPPFDHLVASGARLCRERGSALLVTLMVIVGLSLLGLGFVAVSETENAISVNEKNYVQVLAVAEAGSRLAVEWFQDPDNAQSIEIAAGVPILPENLAVFKRTRTVDGLTTEYKDGGADVLFDKPYRPAQSDRFYGNADSADIVINDSTTEGRDYLTALNAYLFGDLGGGSCRNSASVDVRCTRIAEFRVYAPPQVGGVWADDGSGDLFVEGGTRYGLATIRVTSEKREPTASGESPIIAQRIVTTVVTEWPFPYPKGPIQSNAGLAGGGNFGVHWGAMTAMLNMEYSRERTSLPWHDADDRVKYEYGYDTSELWQAASTYAVGDVVHGSVASAWVATTAFALGDIVAPTTSNDYRYRVTAAGTTAAAEPAWPTTGGSTVTDGTVTWTAEADVKLFSFECTATTGNTGATEPIWAADPPTLGDTVTDGGVTWTVRTAKKYTLDSGASYAYDEDPWLFEIVGKEFEDPWYEARARGDIEDPEWSGTGTTPYHLKGYTANMEELLDGVNGNFTSLFQGQTTTAPPDRDQVTFPRIDYEFWKEIAVQGNGENEVHYLRWDSTAADDDTFCDGITCKRFYEWVNTDPGLTAPAEPGYYFFDSRNGVNPQTTGGADSPFLTPALQVNSADANPFQMKGFIYLNSIEFQWNGIAGVNDWYNYPGEPYRDIGFWEVDLSTGEYIVSAGSFQVEDESNFRWDYQDLNGNGSFDYKLAEKTVDYNDGSPETYTGYFIVPYSPECGIAGVPDLEGGDDPIADGTCSEPHEPYLNILYPEVDPTSGPAPNQPPYSVILGWGTADTTCGAPDNAWCIEHVSRPKDTDGTGSLPDCTDVANASLCTSLGYDEEGGLYMFDPALVGVFYNEGDLRGTGNFPSYGSILINGEITGLGTSRVLFDESILRGTWVDQFDFPRVYISSHQTDQ